MRPAVCDESYFIAFIPVNIEQARPAFIFRISPFSIEERINF